MDPKLNNLVDLVLVVGSDNSTGLVKRIVPKRKVQHSDTNGNYTCEGEDSSDDDDLMLELTDPNTFFDPKVLQLFSASAASYPSRPEDEQLVNYPEQLTPVRAPSTHDVIPEDENEDIITSDEHEAIIRAVRGNQRKYGSLAAPRSLLTRSTVVTPEHRGSVPTLLTSASSNVPKHPVPGKAHTLEDEGDARAGRALKDLGRRPSHDVTITHNGIALVKTKSPEMPLNMEQIGALTQLSFPEGHRCHEFSKKPTITSYVLTDLGGNRFYAVNLTIYRKMNITKIFGGEKGEKSRYHLTDVDTDTVSSRRSLDGERNSVYIPTCVVLVSSQPYFNTLQKCLTDLYAHIQPTYGSFDDYIKKFSVAVTNIPLPPPGGELSLTFTIHLGGMKVVVHPSPHYSRPVVDVNMSLIFSLMKPAVVCTVLAAMLQEQRLVFVSAKYSLLTLVQEIFMNMIYPFRWQSMYVPMLSTSMIGYVEAPGYFIMGCHSDYLDTIESVEGLVIVDVDKGRVIMPTAGEDYAADLPLKAAGRFCTAIVDTDMSFDLSITGDVIYDVVEARQEFHNKLNKQITDICLKMMADLFGDIHDHIIVEQKFFNKNSYLEAQRCEDKVFYNNLIETQMFKSFLREIMSDVSYQPWTNAVIDRQFLASKKPSSRSLQSRQAKKSLALTLYENDCKIFNLPYMHSLSQFQDDCILNLSTFVEMASSSKSTRAASLFVIGALNLQRGQTVQGLNNFGDLSAMDPTGTLFPTTSITKLLKDVDDPITLLDSVQSSHKKLYTELLKASRSKRRGYCVEVKVELENLPNTRVSAVEFDKYAERLDLAVGREAIDRLYKSLTLNREVSIHPDHLKTFYECWKDNEAVCKDMEAALSSRVNTELSDTVLKVSSGVIRTDQGLGHLILTDQRIIVLKSGLQIDSAKEIARISQISKIQLDSVLVMLSPTECLKVYTSGSLRPITLYLKEESKTWRILVNELIGGKIISTNSRDMFLMQQAAHNVLLIDALIASSKSVEPKCLHSEDLEKAVDLIAYYSKEETKQALTIPAGAAKDILLYRLNPNGDELNDECVESIIYVPGEISGRAGPTGATLSRTDTLSLTSNRSPDAVSTSVVPTVWCGMSNGKIKIFDASSWRLYPTYFRTGDRVVCLAHTNSRIWAGSFDHSIYVINNNPHSLECEKLEEHKDCVVDLQRDSAPNSPYMYSGSLDGTIIQWDINSLEPIKQIYCLQKPLTSFRVISQDEIWCCCKQSIIRIDSNGKIISTLFYVDEKDRRVELECFCVIDNNIWAGCAQIGRLVCWDRVTEERRAILPIDARGVSKLVAIGDNLYIGCKSAYFSAKNLDEKSERRSRQDVKDAKSKMYIALTSSFLITEELSAHNDSIKCMHAVGEQYILTGSGNKDGKVAIWKHQPQLAGLTTVWY